MSFVRKEFKPKRVVGVCGGKGHGKDTFASFLKSGVSKNKVGSFVTKSFAGPLKDLASNVFGVARGDMDILEKKEAMLPAPIVIDLFLGSLRTQTGLSVKEHGVVATTLRELLQSVGTDYIRAEDSGYWLNQAAAQIETSNSNVVMSDVRFPNELELIKNLKGLSILIKRIDIASSLDTHASETSIDESMVDLVLGVKTGDLRLPERVAHLISLGKYKHLGIYDYRSVKKALQAYGGGEPLSVCFSILGIKNKDSSAFRFLRDYYGVKERRPSISSNPHRFNGVIEEKNCCNCKDWLSLINFSMNVKTWDGRADECKKCASIRHKASYAKYAKELDLNMLFKDAKRGAYQRKIEFELTLDEVKTLWERQSGLCFYSKRPMTLTKGDRDKVSIDRVNSSKTYTLDNVVLCTSSVNVMKRALSLDEFRCIISDLAKNFQLA